MSTKPATAPVPFTIQSISKAFVFALALERLGPERVEATIGVEPSGEPFNSIHLNNDNRPFNAMVNAGAIACSGLIHQIARRRSRSSASARRSSQLRGPRARTSTRRCSLGARDRRPQPRHRAGCLRNYRVVEGDVDAVLDVYFRQCSILVTARDLAVMAATLANRGINPITGEQVVSPYVVARTLSVMTSSGMYDYAGEWIYRVGIPAKSGVGGGIVAALPAQFGLGTFSPLLDSHGNSVRGLKVCEELSSRFDLHVLNRSSRRAHLHHRRLRHPRHVIAPQPPAARAADSRRAPQRHPRHRTGRRADLRHHRLCDAAAGQRTADAPQFRSSISAACPTMTAARRAAPRREAWRCSTNTGVTGDPDRAGSDHPRSGRRSRALIADICQAARFRAARRSDRMGRRPDHLSLRRL